MHPYPKLLKEAIEHIVRHREVPVVEVSSSLFARQAAVFVVVHERPGHKFRGMAGDILPRKSNIAEEIVYQARRLLEEFPLRREDLAYLTYTVHLLTAPERVESLAQLDPQKYGLAVRSAAGKLAVLLPRMRFVETAEQQFALACERASIDPRQEAVNLYRFCVETFNEQE
jgi:AMMECR1 domain-containing protein